MKVLVIFDSVFGNTGQIAQAMGNALAAQAETTVVQVADVKPDQLAGLDLLLVGSPTRGFRPTPAVADFLKALPANSLKGMRIAAFDTRIATSDIKSAVLRFMVNLGGYAAKPIAGLLQKNGGMLALPPEGFFVKDREGPLKDGELERAAAWAKRAAAGG